MPRSPLTLSRLAKARERLLSDEARAAQSHCLEFDPACGTEVTGLPTDPEPRDTEPTCRFSNDMERSWFGVHEPECGSEPRLSKSASGHALSPWLCERSGELLVGTRPLPFNASPTSHGSSSCD